MDVSPLAGLGSVVHRGLHPNTHQPGRFSDALSLRQMAQHLHLPHGGTALLLRQGQIDVVAPLVISALLGIFGVFDPSDFADVIADGVQVSGGHVPPFAHLKPDRFVALAPSQKMENLFLRW